MHSPSGTSQTHLCLRAAYPWFTLIEVHAKGCSKITGWFSRSQRQKSSKTAGYLFVMPVAATCPVRERTRPRVSLSTEVAPSGKTLVLVCVGGMGVWENNEKTAHALDNPRSSSCSWRSTTPAGPSARRPKLCVAARASPWLGCSLSDGSAWLTLPASKAAPRLET